MSKSVKIKLNSAGVREVLKSAAIQQECIRQAQIVQSRAGTGYETQTRTYPERTGAVIKAVTKEARRDNRKNNTLLKALGG